MAALHFSQALLPDGWAQGVRLTLADGRIAKLETGVEPAAGDERHATALPGLPNLHSHAFQRLMAGLAERRLGPDGDDFWSWRELMYRIVGEIAPQQMAAIAAMAFVEMLEGGFTRVGEFHYLHHQPDGRPFDDPAEMAVALAGAAAETGIALTLLPVFYAHSGFGGQPPQPGQRRFVNDLDGFARLLEASRRALAPLPDAVLGIAPHSLRAVTPEELAALVGMAAGPVHIHIAEQVKEVADCFAWSGARPVEWLLGAQDVGERWCLVHATHMTDAETARLAASGAVAGLCPVTEANLGDGIFPAVDYLAAGGRFGVGSDSNVRIDAGEELRLLEYGQRLIRRQRTVLAAADRSNGRSLFEAALAGGGQALGDTPALKVGAVADIVALAADPLGAGDAALDRWIFANGRVDGVWRAGRRLVSGGRHIARAAVERRFHQAAMQLLG
ncbi:formimidoylglutamate deiminase [Sandaracinobacter neustonicus]|uniref:Formimidoylglutamate deiminase n=1 Tax=Sandaracinobacter neustonicus TaxID=1715348 RepID=A0A501XKD9_9SPHN|nr:formimidoylglutamate deiminase [Sandaracinobacter neustonicus]TPE61131.1 formimidoylglutamate deiminase [Sandaracinobacter neustonicus]